MVAIQKKLLRRVRGSFEVRNNVSAIIAKDHFCMCDGDNRQRTCFVCVNVLLGTYMQYHSRYAHSTLLSKTPKCLGGYIIVDLYLIALTSGLFSKLRSMYLQYLIVERSFRS